MAGLADLLSPAYVPEAAWPGHLDLKQLDRRPEPAAVNVATHIAGGIGGITPKRGVISPVRAKAAVDAAVCRIAAAKRSEAVWIPVTAATAITVSAQRA